MHLVKRGTGRIETWETPRRVRDYRQPGQSFPELFEPETNVRVAILPGSTLSKRFELAREVRLSVGRDREGDECCACPLGV